MACCERSVEQEGLDGLISLVTDWRMQHGISSGPAGFLWFKFANNLYTPFSLTVISGMTGQLFSSSLDMLSRFSMVKTLQVSDLN